MTRGDSHVSGSVAFEPLRYPCEEDSLTYSITTKEELLDWLKNGDQTHRDDVHRIKRKHTKPEVTRLGHHTVPVSSPQFLLIHCLPRLDRWKHLWGMQITSIDPEYKWEDGVWNIISQDLEKMRKWKHLWGMQITSIDPEYKWEVNYAWLM
ncbi:hypothetical protein EDB85DRAFT_1892496 [Lactarius pseudohatsudake]|nr:hypothetical protein EDB85DRAFT_1892496 [Lactarius pseudohatsudake]